MIYREHPIYTITMIEKLEPIYSENNPDKFIMNDYGDTRCLAWYRKKKWAEEALHTNNADIRECLYDYAVLECVREGCYGTYPGAQWFKYDYDKDGFFEIPTPDGESNYCGFGIG